MAENKDKKKYNTGYGGNIFDSFPDFDSLETITKKPVEKKPTDTQTKPKQFLFQSKKSLQILRQRRIFSLFFAPC